MTVAVFSKTLKAWAVRSSSHPNLRTSSPATASSMSWGKHDSNHPAGQFQNQTLVTGEVQGGVDYIGVQNHPHIWE